jgi:Uma2 family endonuclease
MTIAAFRTWYESRPDHEHWELVAGVPTLKQRATRGRRRIASNLDRLLINALQAHCPERASYQRIGINLAFVAPDYDPEPDVIVVDDGRYEERYSDRFYLVAEVVEPLDRKTVESKREIYKRHPDCRCVLVIQQERIEVEVSLLAAAGWTLARLVGAADQLVLEEFGLRCTLADLYRGTTLQPRTP